MKALVFLLFLPLIAHAAVPAGSQAYIDALSRTIRSADRIVVTEHSFALDSVVQQEVVYRTRELGIGQRSSFRKLVERINPQSQSVYSACMFEPHHTIHFYSRNEEISTMRICFKCNQIEWDGSKDAPPGAIYGALRSFILRIGLEPSRDWRALAEAHSQRPAVAKKAEPLAPEVWPVSVDAVVADMISALSEEDKDIIRRSERKDLLELHRRWGPGIREHYGLTRGNVKLLESACGRACHPERASIIIITKLRDALQKPELSAKAAGSFEYSMAVIVPATRVTA